MAFLPSLISTRYSCEARGLKTQAKCMEPCVVRSKSMDGFDNREVVGELTTLPSRKPAQTSTPSRAISKHCMALEFSSECTAKNTSGEITGSFVKKQPTEIHMLLRDAVMKSCKWEHCLEAAVNPDLCCALVN